MQYEVVVPIPVQSIWDTFHDAERLAQCIPGLLLDEPARAGADGPELTGRWKLRVGTNTVTYRGTLRLRDADLPLTLTALVDGDEVRGSARVGAELTVRLYDQRAGDAAEYDTGETRIVIDATLRVEGEGRTSEFGSARLDGAFARAADLFAAALTDELAPVPDTPFEPVVAISDPFATPRPRIPVRPVLVPDPKPGSESDLWSEVGRGTGRTARRALRVFVPVLGALVVWRLVRVRRRRAG
ncbi:CoxG family protein [Embleya sp. NBC_00896]|uniref:CoxG family protein n=1 Tax=Embleya sp. NBC_00896 TaxID=2975961 RepID=UPI003865B91D|nr:SRPBCC domain-containing protein [Embleya sp. NBC_00896]